MSAEVGQDCTVLSECEDLDLYVDEDDNEVKKPRIIGVSAADEPTKIICTWSDCGQVFNDHLWFIKHIREHTVQTELVDDVFLCKFPCCEYQTKCELSFYKHTTFHSYHERLKNIGANVVDRLKLPDCTTENHFEVPENIHYSCKWASCDFECGALLEFKYHIKLHVFTASQAFPKRTLLQCQWLGCQYKFSSPHKHVDHMRSHTQEKVIACPTCGQLFATKTRFADHRRRQIPPELQNFQCSECSKWFASDRLLKDHMTSHVSRYKCSHCKMLFSRPSLLATHTRFRHMTERPYKCSLCDHSCVSKSNLNQHLTTHCPEKLFACVHCSFRCRSIVALERHLQREHGQEASQYECHCCKERFNRGTALSVHLMRKHKYTWPNGHSRFRYKLDPDGLHRLCLIPPINSYSDYLSDSSKESQQNNKSVVVDQEFEIVPYKDSSSNIPHFVVLPKSSSK